MGVSPNLPTFFFFLLSSVLFCISQATIFEIINQCSYTVWAAAIPGGGKKLKPDETWVMSVNETNYTTGRIWGRTNCTFNASGDGSCETGDCSNKLDCEDNGVAPVTLADFTVGGYNNKDFYDVSLVNGFNIPLEISPNNGNCGKITCSADIKDECPVELRAPGGCNHPCKVFKTDLYCCTTDNCTATYLSDFFKTKCPDAFSFAYDDRTGTFSCPTGSNYRVLFCPSVSSPSPFSPPSYDSSLAHMCVRINLRY